MSRRGVVRGVVITGMGVVCPLGDRPDVVFDAL